MTVLIHWRQQEFIELITVQKKGEHVHTSVKLNPQMKEGIVEHKRNIKLNKETTALAKLNRKEDIEIDFTHIKKLSNYENHNYVS